MSAAQFATPMMRQYAALKRAHPAALLLFRCGDFYETYGEDAEEAGRLLNIVVTRKAAGADGDVPMAGVPFHSLETYLARLVRAGKRVAIAEQMEDPATAKGIVRRDVVRVVTPGTATEEALLDGSANNYLVALLPAEGGAWGVALADVSTGYFGISELAGADAEENLASELDALDPRELLLPEDADAPFLAGRTVAVTRLPAGDFRHETARRLLLDHFRVQSLDGFGAEELRAATSAGGALMRYLRETQKGAVTHISNLRVRHAGHAMVLDSVTQRSLELVRNLHGGGREATLVAVLDRTVTPMGARMLRGWMLAPLRDAAAISARLDAVEEFASSLALRSTIGEGLRGVRDLERIVSRACLGAAGPRELVALRQGLERLPRLRETLLAVRSGMLRECGGALDLLEPLRDLLARALLDDPPATAREGNIIREGYSPDLDEIKNLSRDSKSWIAELRSREAARTGVANLKISFNRVFGYYIELTHAQVRSMGGTPPADYIRKQTIANGERFVTTELKEKEDIILHAEERMSALEAKLYEELRQRVASEAAAILRDAELLARVDCLRSLAEAAIAGGYCRPEIDSAGRLEIVDGRHPVLEAIQNDPPFVANDTVLDPVECQVALITGPNMAGKSTYIRQVALIVLMAHMGSFVPARRASIPIVDRIFTRVGAMDHLARGQSTFLVEMSETSNILRHATSESLVILDEIGRGTSTYDGLSIAWAVCEFLHNTAGQAPKTLFATHYHELTDLDKALPRLRNFHVAVHEERGRIAFLYRIVRGATDRSYGIHAAEYAGVPRSVVARAREILSGLEKGDAVAPRVAAEASPDGAPRARKRAAMLPTPEPWEAAQLSFLDSATPNPAVERLRQLDPQRLTPLEALVALNELKRLAGEE